MAPVTPISAGPTLEKWMAMNDKTNHKKYLKCPYYEPEREESKRCGILA